MKKIISLLFAVIMLTSAAGVNYSAIAEETASTDKSELVYTVSENAVEITGSRDKNLKSLIIPAELEGKAVTRIAPSAFENHRSLKKIALPEGLTEIGEGAFLDCISLKSVKIPKSVTKIGKYALGICRKETAETESGVLTEVPYGIKISSYRGTEAQRYCASVDAMENGSIYFTALDYSAPKFSVKSGKGSLTVKYKKAKKAAGYQIKYTKNGGSKTKTYKSKKAASRTIRRLKKGKYSVRVRAYYFDKAFAVTENSQRVYSKWSKPKSVKVR